MAARDKASKLVLWDIDHTLIETRGFGTQLYLTAFERVTGRPVEYAVDPTGLTELAIFAETLKRHRIPASDELRQRYTAELASLYTQHIEVLRSRGRELPGARSALMALAEREGLVQSVLTGNLQAVAVIKLRAFALDPYIDFEVGAYGDDDLERAKLIDAAQARAAVKYGVSFDEANTVIVGDTVQDVLAARQGGASIVGVASGRDSAEKLRAAGAAMVLPDLTDTLRMFVAVCPDG